MCLSVRLPRHSVWPILPGASSFLNYKSIHPSNKQSAKQAPGDDTVFLLVLSRVKAHSYKLLVQVSGVPWRECPAPCPGCAGPQSRE